MSPFFSRDNRRIFFIHSFEFLTPWLQCWVVFRRLSEDRSLCWHLGCWKCNPGARVGAWAGGRGAWTALQPWGAWSARPSPGRAECGSLTPVYSCFCTFFDIHGVRFHYHGQCMCAALFASPQSWLFTPDTTNTTARGPCYRQCGPGAVLCCQHLYFQAAWGRRHYLNKTLGRSLPFLLQDVIF